MNQIDSDEFIMIHLNQLESTFHAMNQVTLMTCLEHDPCYDAMHSRCMIRDLGYFMSITRPWHVYFMSRGRLLYTGDVSAVSWAKALIGHGQVM